MSAINNNNFLPSEFQKYIHISRYSRWLPDGNRRESWPETVARYFDFFTEHLAENHNYRLTKELRDELEDAVLNLEVMPSMRALMTAGPALKRDHIAGYNCAYIAVDRPTAFDEILYVLMNGTGVGFSVERQYVSQLPTVAEDFHATDTTIVVADSKAGWGKALKELIGMLYVGQIPKWDTTKLREAGAPLKTFGGRSSGPEPLIDLFKFAVNLFKHAAGRKLSSLECHDLVCKIASVVVVGGVRRSALISLSNLSDDRMRQAKSGQWWEMYGHRALANNSYVATEKPEMGVFMDEWLSLYNSKSGERGIFSRYGAKKHIQKLGRRDPEHEWGCNPCSEILLRSRQFCNLTEIVVRASDNFNTLARKARIATILGTFQSTLTDFRYISKEWKRNCEEERLLGVSLTGIMDNAILNGSSAIDNLLGNLPKQLEGLRDHVIAVNAEFAKALGINPSTATTCVKPSGTVSSLVDSAAGIHARHSPYYIRRIRADKKDPVSEMMFNRGFPYEDDVTAPKHTNVFAFPVKAPQEKGYFRENVPALQQLELWKIYQKHWCEHKPSVTISVREDEWMEVGAWVYKNFDDVSGISFLPYSDSIYKQAPYEECTAEDYEALKAKMPEPFDWHTELKKYEMVDTTTGNQELACSGTSGGCEII